jgi:poly(3-hydroxybutyrate) depolymerase
MIMTDPSTYTAEHRAWEWELVLEYEGGSLPASKWSPETLAIIATWYAKNLTPEQATTRYEQHYHKNRHRLTHRRDNATVATASIEAVDAVWASLLKNALERKGGAS